MSRRKKLLKTLKNKVFYGFLQNLPFVKPFLEYDIRFLLGIYVVGYESEPDDLGNGADRCERVRIDRADDIFYGRDLSAMNHANEHGTIFARVHTDGRQGGDAALQRPHKCQRNFFRLGCDDTKFDRGMETAQYGFVRLALDIRFERGHHDRQQSLCDRVALEYENGTSDDDAVDQKQHVRDRRRPYFFLDQDGKDIRAARAAAALKRKRDRDADAKSAGERCENLFAVVFENDLEIGQETF